jgi:plastocyanin
MISARAEMVIEGLVKLPPVKPVASAAARYQQKAGAVAIPEPPTAVVYLEGSFPNRPASSSGPAIVGQKSFQFAPGLLPVQKGTAVEFPNLDDDYHHVFSYSKIKEFDLGRYRGNEKPAAVLFDKTGVIKVGCEIHDHMRAIILVLDTPHFTKTDAEGKYRLILKDVPPGQYVLKAWVNERTIWEQPVDLKEGLTLQTNFSGK